MKNIFWGLSALWLSALAPQCEEKHFDLLIQDATIIDGTGKPRFVGDVGVSDGKIAAVGSLLRAQAPEVINAKGLVLTPGFIDVHTHIEGSLSSHPLAENFVLGGVTSIVTGNCGGSARYLDTFFLELKKTGVALNVGSLYGHNTARNAVMGNVNRAPTAPELAAMQQIVTQAMQAGALGLSTGLIYVPGTFAKTDEIVALAKMIKPFAGVYVSHIRNEDYRVFDAIDEAVAIGRGAEVPVQISHLKITGKNSWGKSREILTKIEDYRRQGLDVTADQYPYTASSTILDTQLPDWAKGGGKDSLRLRLKQPATRARIVAEMKEMLAKTGFDDYQWAVVSGCPWNVGYNGKSIPEVAEKMGLGTGVEAQIAAILDICTRRQPTYMIYHKMSEEDVQRLMAYPYCMVASDAGVATFGSGLPHPRAYGSNTRVLGRYVREEKVLPLEEAVRKMTQFPALRFGLFDRGVIAPGMAADLVLFDAAQVADRATFDRPHAYPAGLRQVWVNGVPVAVQGKPTGKKPGQMLRNRRAQGQASAAKEGKGDSRE